MGPAGLILSLALLAGTCALAVRLAARSAEEAFWVAALAAPCQLGVLSVLCSWLGRFDGPSFLFAQVLLLVAAAAVARARPRKAPSHPSRPSLRQAISAWRGDPVCTALILTIAAFLLTSAARQWGSLLVGHDERMYHASRVAYWLQHKSIFFFQTHNDRQTVFPFGGELFFAWPLLFVKHELAGRMVFWLALPASTLAVILVTRVVGASRRASLAAAVLYLATPAVLLLGAALKSDAWLPLFVLGSAYFALRPAAPGEPQWRRFVLAGIFFALAVNIKTTSMALAPGLALAAMAGARLRPLIGRALALGLGFLGGALASGLIVLLISNTIHHGGPLGPAAMSKVHMPDFSLQQVRAHAARAVLFLFEPPEVPSEKVRQAIESRGRKLAQWSGASAVLPLEDGPWPGRFNYQVQPAAASFSLGGMVWIPSLLLGLATGALALRRAWPRLYVGPLAMLTLIQLPLLLGAVFLIRWMGAGPVRFWIGAYALSVPLTAALADRWARRSAAAAGLAMLLLVLAAYPGLRSEIVRLDWSWIHPAQPAQLDEPFQEVVPLLEPGSRILLVANGATRDYPLFCPRDGFPNAVFPWGTTGFDAARAERMLRDHRITHVLLESDQAVGFHWAGGMQTYPFVKWIGSRPDFVEVPLKTANMRLYTSRAPPDAASGRASAGRGAGLGSLPGFLPPLFFLALTALIGIRRRPDGRPGPGPRDSLVPACILTGVWLVLGTELLSALRLLEPGAILLWWGAPTSALLAAVVIRRRAVAAWLRPAPMPDRTTWVLFALAASILVPTGLVAATTPVNTWDCLIYHMPRQVYWLQNHTVSHFPAGDLRQLEMPPLAEFASAHLMALSGGDRWADIIQWFALLATAIVASSTARLMGAKPRGQALAALLVVALPAAASQATNGKNDIVVALWIMILAYLAARFLVERTSSPPRVLLIGAALGLALLTKGTGYIAAAPLCLIIGIALVVYRRWRSIPAGLLIAGVALAINAGHYSRNQAVFHSPLSAPQSTGGYRLRNETFAPAALVSNLVRNVSLHTAAPSQALNRWQERQIEHLHKIIGIASDDPRTTAGAAKPFAVEYTPSGDGTAPGPVHLLLGAGLLLTLARPRRLAQRPAWPLYLAPAAAFLTFCAILMWQPWHQRLHIPITLLVAPAAGAWLTGPRRGPLFLAVGFASAALAWPTILYNNAKPILGPQSVFRRTGADIMFHGNERALDGTRAAVDAAMALRPRVLALSMKASAYEYALQKLILDSPAPTPLLRSFNPNFGRDLKPRGPDPEPDPVPDLVIEFAADGASPILHHQSGQLFQPIALFPPWAIYASPRFLESNPSTATALPFGPWKSITGLSPAVGPFPRDNLPVVRWAKERTVRIRFPSEGAPTTLILDCRRYDGTARPITVSLNGQAVGAIDPGPNHAFIQQQFNLSPRRAMNDIVLDTVNSDEPGPDPAVLFRALRIVPDRPPSP